MKVDGAGKGSVGRGEAATPHLRQRGIDADNRPEVLVHAEWRSEDPVRTFYEVPENIAAMVRAQATYDGEPFDSCLHNIALAFNAALAEMARLKRHAKSR